MIRGTAGAALRKVLHRDPNLYAQFVAKHWTAEGVCLRFIPLVLQDLIILRRYSTTVITARLILCGILFTCFAGEYQTGHCAESVLMEEEEVSFDGEVALNQLELGVRICACELAPLQRTSLNAACRRKEAESN